MMADHFLQQEEEDNQRQFKCKCGKKYKSYPALYTHIKNKHPQKIDQYKNQSKKPKQGEIEKGRPKKHKNRPQQAEDQGDLLNIIQLGILSLEKHLRSRNHSENFYILQGNTKIIFTDLQQKYNQVKGQICSNTGDYFDQNPLSKKFMNKLKNRQASQIKSQKPVKIYKQQILFKTELIQHFYISTSVNVLIELQIIEIQEEFQKQLTNQLNKQNSQKNLLMQLNYDNTHVGGVQHNSNNNLSNRTMSNRNNLSNSSNNNDNHHQDAQNGQLPIFDNYEDYYQSAADKRIDLQRLVEMLEDKLWNGDTQGCQIVRRIYKEWNEKNILLRYNEDEDEGEEKEKEKEVLSNPNNQDSENLEEEDIEAFQLFKHLQKQQQQQGNNNNNNE